MRYVIVGAGIVGACAAYYLSREKEHEVILVDEAFEGKATQAGAGIICPWISRVNDPEHFALTSRGALYYPELIESLYAIGETNTGYASTGALAVSENLQEVYALKERVEEQRKQFPLIGDINVMDAPNAKEYFPPLHADLHALSISGSARVDGRLLANALINAFKKNGGKVLEEKAGLEIADNHVDVLTSNERMKADEVIVAAGAWTNHLLDPIGIQVNQEPQRGQIVHLSVNEDTSKWPVVLPQDSSHYIVAFDDNRIAFGATREKESGLDYRVTAGGVQEVLHQGLEVAPGLEANAIKEVRVGFRPMSPDNKPLLGRMPQLDNLIVATGTGPSGLTMGPYVGALASQIALHEEAEIDLSAYQPLR